TVEGVTAVIDSGLARVPTFDPATGMDRLERVQIARDSSDQRAGRAGRVRPGICIRLWSEMEQRALQPRTLPELARVDLAPAVLQLLCWGEPDATAFPWLESPPARALELALDTLRRLGALHAHGVTALGRELARIPTHPRLALLLLEGARFGVADRAAKAAALLSERDPFQRPRGPVPTPDACDSDVLERVFALEVFERSRTTSFGFGDLLPQRARFLMRAARQFERLVDSNAAQGSEDVDPDEGLLRALFAGFSDRLARRRERGSPRAQMVGGRGVCLAPGSGVTEPDLFVCVDIAGGSKEHSVRLASAVDVEWLDPDRFEEASEVRFDSQRERVVGRRTRRWDGLLMSETERPVEDSEAAATLLVEAAEGKLERVVDRSEKDLAGFLARWACLREWLPELDLAACDDTLFTGLLPTLAANRHSFADLRRAPWLDSLRGLLSHQQAQALKRDAPERLQIPTGDHLRLTYEVGRPPVLAARIQELFGLLETPRVARGRVKVLIHLLAPNRRPQQVTDDLESFWRNTYPLVRKELRTRYPRHAWPEDPFSARPERRPRRRK
ncbi:MAG: ATP-dependent helicase HrpB, partial [Chlamydiales bacterium]